MKDLTVVYLNGCPYCAKAKKALENLKSENPRYAAVHVEMVEENENPARLAGLDYYHVPSLFIGEEKLFEASPGDSYEKIEGAVASALERALQ